MNNEPTTPILTTQIEPTPSRLRLQKNKLITAVLAAAALVIIAILIISSSALTNQFIPADVGTSSTRSGNTEIIGDGTAAGGDYLRFFANPPTGGNGGKKCIVTLHGSMGTPAPGAWEFESTYEGYALYSPLGNRVKPEYSLTGWGYNPGTGEFDDPDGSGYIAAKQIIADAMSTCGTVVVEGYSNGAGLAGYLWCNAETFGGKVIGYVLDDPEDTAYSVENCQRPQNIKVALYGTGALSLTSTWGEFMGIPVQASRECCHGMQINPYPVEVKAWLDAAEGGNNPTPTPAPTPTPVQSGGLPSVVRIMPIGDGITTGRDQDGTINGYRAHLLTLLSTVSGHSYDYVGSQVAGDPPLNDREFEGHAGWCLDTAPNGCFGFGSMLANIDSWLTSASPDLVLLNGGVNDIEGGRTPAEALQFMSSIVDRVFAARPSAYVVVQTVTQDGGPSGNHIPFNTLIRDYVAQKQGQGAKVYLADTSTVTSSADFAEYVHPSDSGYQKFAQIIFDAIRQQL